MNNSVKVVWYFFGSWIDKVIENKARVGNRRKKSEEGKKKLKERSKATGQIVECFAHV